jgi:hypothetical protein
MVTTDSATTPAAPEGSTTPDRFHWLAANPGKRRTEVIYFVWFLLTIPMQIVVSRNLSWTHSNDLLLNGQAVIMALGTLLLPILLRAPEDRGRPLTDLYGFRMGIYLVIWSVLGGFVGTDPWYEVLHGHFAFNTDLNPNGVPLFMLPMTVSVFAFYTAILGTLYRVITQLLDRTRTLLVGDNLVRHTVLCALLAPLIPIVENFGYTSDRYCFDSSAGMWTMNFLIYGAWQFAGLLFYTRWDVRPGEKEGVKTTILAGFATIGIIVVLMAITKNFIAPHFVDVQHGLRQINDWSADNCLGPRP